MELSTNSIEEIEKETEYLQGRAETIVYENEGLYDDEFMKVLAAEECSYLAVFEKWRYFYSFGLPNTTRPRTIRDLVNMQNQQQEILTSLERLEQEQKQDDEAFVGRKSSKEYINAKNRRKTAANKMRANLEIATNLIAAYKRVLEKFNIFDTVTEKKSVFPSKRAVMKYTHFTIDPSMDPDDRVELNRELKYYLEAFNEAYRLRDPEMGFPSNLRVWIEMLQNSKAILLDEIDGMREMLDEAAERGGQEDMFPRISWWQERKEKRTKMQKCIGCNAPKVEYFFAGTDLGVCSEECAQ